MWIGGSWILSTAADTWCRERTELLQCTQKEKLCCAMSLEGWIGARSHREAQIVTSIIFIILKRRSHYSIVSRWVTRSDIFIRWASTGKSTDERHGDKFHYYIWFICKSVSEQNTMYSKLLLYLIKYCRYLSLWEHIILYSS